MSAPSVIDRRIAPRLDSVSRYALAGAVAVPLAVGIGGEQARRLGLGWLETSWVEALFVTAVLVGYALVAASYLRRAHAASGEASARLRAIVDHSPLGIVGVAPDGTVTDWNRAAEQIFGWRESEVVGASYPAAAPSQTAEFLAAIADVAANGPQVFERVRHRRDGSDVDVAIAAAPLHASDGTFTGVSAVIADVSEQARAKQQLEAALEQLRDSEARFRALIETSRDLIAICDENGVYRYASPSHERVLGYAPEALVGRCAFEVVHPDDTPKLVELYNARVTIPGATATRTFRAQHADGGYRFLEAVGLNLLDDPAVGGVVVAARDVTERIALEQRLRSAERLEAIGQLAGGIAHDFNNVLLVVRGYGSVLRAELSDSQQIADVDEIIDAADRAANLTRQLLAFGRRLVLRPAVLSLPETVRDLQSLLRRTIEERIELVLELDDDAPAVLADESQIEQVLLNLVVNARDATPAGGRIVVGNGSRTFATATSSTTPGLQPGTYATLSVADTGTGIPPELMSHLFEPFFTTKGEGVGTGLGLATVYGIVTQSGGAVGVESVLDRGTTFTVYLPVAEGPAANEALDEPEPAATVGTERILVVEDEAPVRALVQRLLEDAGYGVVAAALPGQALEILAGAAEVDLLLTDVVMPEMSGFELAARVRAERPGMRFLFISGYRTGVAAAPGQTAGPVLQKPFASEELRRAVRRVLDEPAVPA